MTPKHTLTDKGRQTRRRILDAAADLLHHQGINATSVGDVLRASGTGKGQFYQHFDSRDHLLAEVLKSHRDLLAQAPRITDWDELETWLRAHVEAQRSFEFERGCPVGTAAYALQPDQDEPRAVLKEIFDHMRTAIADFIGQEQAAGRFDDSADPVALGHFTVAAIQGATLLSLLDRNDQPADASINATIDYLKRHGSTVPRTAR